MGSNQDSFVQYKEKGSALLVVLSVRFLGLSLELHCSAKPLLVGFGFLWELPLTLPFTFKTDLLIGFACELPRRASVLLTGHTPYQ